MAGKLTDAIFFSFLKTNTVETIVCSTTTNSSHPSSTPFYNVTLQKALLCWGPVSSPQPWIWAGLVAKMTRFKLLSLCRKWPCNFDLHPIQHCSETTILGKKTLGETSQPSEPHSQPSESWDIINCCYFKPLNLEVVCCAAIGNPVYFLIVFLSVFCTKSLWGFTKRQRSLSWVSLMSQLIRCEANENLNRGLCGDKGPLFFVFCIFYTHLEHNEHSLKI